MRLHYWQMHPEHIRPGINQSSRNNEKEAKGDPQQVPDEKSDPVEERHSGGPVDYQKSNRDGKTDHTIIRSKDYSSMEKVETEYLSIIGKTETIATTSYQLQESLEIFESTMGAIEHELGENINVAVEQAEDTCETDTFADESTVNLSQGNKMEGTNKGMMEGELSGRKDANPKLVQLANNQPVNILENSDFNETVIGTIVRDMNHVNEDTDDVGIRKM